jgi:hypothetical protein
MIITIYWTDTRALLTLVSCAFFLGLAHSVERWRVAERCLLRSYP